MSFPQLNEDQSKCVICRIVYQRCIYITCKADIDNTRKADIDNTRKADIDYTRKADILYMNIIQIPI